MGTVTWSTAPIPASALRAGDRVLSEGRLLPVDGDPVDVGSGRVQYRAGTHWVTAEGGDRLVVSVPDEPVDGYSLWKPKPSVWPSGCVCLIRANPKMPGNWETVVRDEQCRGHYDWNDYED